ncbi:uncharacterized protein [Panulirus ornatus]|uniref:uncharacterized protein isoform X2 n=1 Tax=Panulirus ornatus TaxID=150431 RepID=UPI003A8A22FA
MKEHRIVIKMSRANMSTTSSEHSNATSTSARIKRAPSSASSNGSSNKGVPGRKQQLQQQGRKSCCPEYHLNSVWSIWYCMVTLGFTGYLVFAGVKRFLLYASLPWPEGEDPPYVELNAYVGLVGASVVVVPFFLVTSVLKVGNLANDGFKLGASLSTCSRDPPPVLPDARGLVRILWLHGVPTAPFLHLVAAFCLLIPRTVMDATLITAGFLPRDEIWHTDLDFLVPHNDRLMVLGINSTTNPAFLETLEPELPPSTLNPETITVAPLHSSHSHHSSKLTPTVYVKVEESSVRVKKDSTKAQVVERRGFLNTKSTPDRKPSYARLPEDGKWSPLSPELLNYSIALLVFAIRYPSVFWHTNKSFGLLFSLQLIVNGIHIILTITAFTILYKLHVCGSSRELHGGEDFLLNLPSTIGLLVIAVMVVTVSSSAIYFYGYQKFTNFVVKSRQRYHITYENEPGLVRPYTPHCAALIVLVALGLSHGPLLWDLSLVYRGSLDAVVLAAVIGTIVHLFLWIVLWLLLTVKSTWTFKLRVTVARACVSSARSIKLVNDVELASGDSQSQAHTPLLVVGSGKAYAINDSTPKKTIMSVVQKTHQEKRARGEEEEIYWLRPSKPICAHSQSKPMSPRTKVTFDEGGILTSPRKGKVVKSSDIEEPTYRRVTTLSDSEDEAGDYALLREAPDVNHKPQKGEDPRYVDRQQILAYRRAMEERLSAQPTTASSVPDYEEADHLHMRSPQTIHHLDAQGPMTPRSTRSNDSGVVQEDRSQRSDSVSTSSSNTPPENSEESGVHSGATDLLKNRSNSVDDLSQLPPDPNQVMTPPKAMSMQRPSLSSSPCSPYRYSPVGGNSSAGTVSPVPGSILYPATESTVVIRRQRNLTQEIKPPVDPIYGTRPLTSFTDQQQQDIKRRNVNEDLMAMAQNNFNSSQSTNSSGYHSSSANASSGSNSSSNSPVPQHSGTSVAAVQPIYGQKTHNGIQNIYGQMGRPGSRISANNSHTSQSIYGRTMSGSSGSLKLPQAPQIPLPPIPQGAVPSSVGHQSSLQDIYGRTNGQKIYGHLGETNNIYGTGPARHPVGRSVSLRSSGAVPKYNTGGFSYLSRESNYNTNV